MSSFFVLIWLLIALLLHLFTLRQQSLFYMLFFYICLFINDTIKLTKVGFVEMFIENRICKNKLLGLCKKYYTRKVGGAL